MNYPSLCYLIHTAIELLLLLLLLLLILYLQENEDVNIENFSITTAVHEAAFEALGQQEKNSRNNLE